MYGAPIEKFKITRKQIEMRTRQLIRNKAIVSYAPVWKGRNFRSKASVLSLIGQGEKSQNDTTEALPVPQLESTQIVSSDRAAVCVSATNQTVRQVKPHSGKKRKSLGVHSKQRLVSHFDQRVSNAVYDRRLALLSVTCVAWSPLLGDNLTVLAVGTESGHLILWRCQTSEGLNDLSERFQILGAPSVSTSEICLAKWKAVQAPDASWRVVFLVVADVSGQVKLWTLNEAVIRPSQEISDPSVLLHGGFQVHRSDLRPSSCMEIEVIGKEPERQQLQICIGKTGGALSVWSSQSIASIQHPDFLAEWFAEGKLFLKYDCHSNKTITGISSNAFMNLISTVGLDAQLEHWTIQENELTWFQSDLLDASEMATSIQALYGIASSPCGLIIAGLKDSGEKYRDAQEQRMVWKRVAHGSIQLKRLSL